MKLFLDSANINDLEFALDLGFIKGVTTNPSLLSKEPKSNFNEHIKNMVKILKDHKSSLPLSVEVFTNDPDKMIEQAKEIYDLAEYEHLNIKIPIGWRELKAISVISEFTKVNVTCIFNVQQSIIAAGAGGHYLSIFFGRLKDIGGYPIDVITETKKILKEFNSNCEIIAGSIRNQGDVLESISSGADIVTTSLEVLESLTPHPQTDKSVNGFLKDFESWIS
tara:strand:- start:1549 stop:2214 length:666 start_codon:yes stop_codon:yes gene_type:complete